MARLRHVVLLVLFVAVSLSKQDSEKPGYAKYPDDASFSPKAKRALPNCSESEKKCGDGKCIHGSQICDGLAHCSDGSDEVGCNCAEGLFKCRTSELCIPRERRCDNTPDCQDESDEINCSDLTKCGASTCNSNGACVELLGGGILCTCNPGFEGDNCETDINYCDSSPCENGGTCTEETTGFTCTCDAAFTGKTCCTDVTECGAITCNSNGDCLELVGGGVKCDCNPGFTGDNCETDINYCDSSPCENGGTCSEETTGFTCSCGASWTGTTCGTDVTKCGASTCNSNGACVELVGGGIVCTCDPGFTGDNCNITIAGCPAKWIYASGSNKCLRILTSKVTFATARKECKIAGGRLAQLATKAAVDEAFSLLSTQHETDYWVDISLQTEGDCDSFATPDGVIIPSNSPLWYASYPRNCDGGNAVVVWFPSYPRQWDGGPGKAVVVYFGGYWDVPLDRQYQSLCEIDL